MSHTLKVKVALNLAKQSIAVKIAKGRHYVTSMTGNANFSTPNPTVRVQTEKGIAIRKVVVMR